MKKVRMRRLVCIKPCRFYYGKFEVHFEFGVKYPIVLKADGHWWLINPAQKKSIMLHPSLIPSEKIREFFIRWNPNKRGSKYERWKMG